MQRAVIVVASNSRLLTIYYITVNTPDSMVPQSNYIYSDEYVDLKVEESIRKVSNK